MVAAISSTETVAEFRYGMRWETYSCSALRSSKPHCRRDAYGELGRRSVRIWLRRSGLEDRPKHFDTKGRSGLGSPSCWKSSSTSGKFAAKIPCCSARYMVVGVLPHRDGATRITWA